VTSPTTDGQGWRPIRWYHMAVYKLFYWCWNPLLACRPEMCRMYARRLNNWADMVDPPSPPTSGEAG
jgi:hypothetical protein